MLGLSQPQVYAGSNSRARSEGSVQVFDIHPGDVNLDPAFRVAIYENLLDELAKAGHFRRVFRSGDRNASGWPDLLVLKTTIRGATKLKVQTQLCTRGGRVVLERSFDGNVRLFGSNLRATRNLAHNMADVT